MNSFTKLLGCTALFLAQATMAQSLDRETLPIREKPFAGVINERVEDSRGELVPEVVAPQNAPNVLLIMTDDVGFATSSAFGGPVPTPVLDNLASQGVRYNRFHTTGICSPTRAALLTGRNHHAAGNGYLSDLPSEFPGYRGEISDNTATIARVLTLNGYSTAMFGKHHNTLKNEVSAAGPFDGWPTGLGFQYFFGFMGGDSDQYRPTLYRGTNPVSASEGGGEMLDKRLVDDAISWVHNVKAAQPDKPFFVYLAPGTLHAPHQAPREWIDRFKGQFDQGWDKLREQTLKRQLANGVVPKGTKLTPRPEQIPAWDSLSKNDREYAARMMEVATGTLAYQDAQIGRLLAELKRMGELDNTLVIFVEGDNGASGEAGPAGTLNEIGHLANRIVEEPEYLRDSINEMGGPHTYQSYPVGWAWALATPLRWVKQFSSYLGGIRNGMVMSWPGHEKSPGSICSHFGHVIDVAPTIYEAVGIPAPREVYGFEQKPINGQSLLSTLESCKGTPPRTQYFEMGGKIGIYKNDWFASLDDGRTPWTNVPPADYKPRWELFNLQKDFSQATDLAARYPDKLRELQEAFHEEALANGVYPLDHRFSGARRSWADRGMKVRNRFDYWSADTSVAFDASPRFAGKAFSIDADVTLDSNKSSGVILATGSHFGGWSFYLNNGVPTVAHALSAKPSDLTSIGAKRALPVGKTQIRFSFRPDGGIGSGGTVTIIANYEVIGTGTIPQTIITPAGLGENLDIGRDTGVPVISYATPEGKFTGHIEHVVLTLD